MDSWEPSQHSLIDTVKPRKKPVPRWPVAGPSGYWLLASNLATKVRKTAKHTHTHTHSKIIHIRKQRYTQDNNTISKTPTTVSSSITTKTIWYDESPLTPTNYTLPKYSIRYVTCFNVPFLPQIHIRYVKTIILQTQWNLPATKPGHKGKLSLVENVYSVEDFQSKEYKLTKILHST